MQFKDVLVPNAVKEQLLQQVRDQRISHAQLFLSQPGSNAFSLAVAFGQYLCCEHPTETDSCGECPSCKQFAKLEHPDLHIYFPNSTTKSITKDPDSIKLAQNFIKYALDCHLHVDIQDWLLELGGENKQASINVRDCSHIINQNSIRAYQGGYKIYILWNVDRLHHDAAPKLLKTLEEPEPKSLFILISEKPENILSTIRSRTQLVKFPRLTDEEIAQGLMQDFPDLSLEEANKIALLSEGNYNKALDLHQNDSDLDTMLAYFDQMMSSVVALARQQSPAEVHYKETQDSISAIVKKGREYQKHYLELTLRMLRNILMQSGNQSQMVKATSYENEIISKYKFNLKQITLMTDECNKAVYHISRNGNGNLVFTDLLFKLANCLK